MQRSLAGESSGSELVTFLRSILRQRQNLRAFLGHQNCVLKLSGKAAVLGADGPAIGLVDLGFPDTLVDHWLNRQTGAWADDGFAGLQIGEVRDTRFLMKIAADSVPLEFANHLKALIPSKTVDGSANIDDSAKRLDGTDADPHRIERNLHESLGIWRDLADQKRFGRIAVPPIDDRGEIDVDDVSLAQDVVIRDSVANNLVDAGANRVWVAVVTQTGRRMAVLNRVVVSELVDLSCRDAGPDMRSQVVHDFGIKSASSPEGFAVCVRGVDRNFGQRSGLRP